MIYEVIVDVSEDRLNDLMTDYAARKISPSYSNDNDSVERAKTWIIEHKNIISDAAMSWVYDSYRDDFKDERIMSKNKFYELCRQILDVASKNVRIGDYVQYCFFKSQDERK